LPTVSLVHIVTQWSGSGGTEAYLSGQLASFSALTLLVGSSAWPVKIVPEMTYNVSSGTFNLCSLTHPLPFLPSSTLPSLRSRTVKCIWESGGAL